jgi:hypothetical protein
LQSGLSNPAIQSSNTLALVAKFNDLVFGHKFVKTTRNIMAFSGFKREKQANLFSCGPQYYFSFESWPARKKSFAIPDI